MQCIAVTHHTGSLIVCKLEIWFIRNKEDMQKIISHIRNGVYMM